MSTRGSALVAMSGGVDSSVAAALLLDQGYEVTGVTMKLWGGDQDTGCCSVSDVEDARRVADQLGITHHVFNFGDEFDANVVDHYVEAHRAGRTPNPCVECNRHLKFDKLLRRADALGFDLVATGHHARIVERGGRLHVARGSDAAKDQSYVLHMLSGDVLARLLFPVGDITKDDVRAIAARSGLRTATKADSQDVCFISRTDGGRRRFLEQRIELSPGRVVDGSGNQVGAVDAVELVTTGQRKGLGVSGRTEPEYVVGVDVATATVTVGPRSSLMVSRTPVRDLWWVSEPSSTAPVAVQTSAHGATALATVDGDGVEWLEQHTRVAPGQSIVFYSGDAVVGSAIAA